MRKAWALHSSGAEAQKLEGRGQKADPFRLGRNSQTSLVAFARHDSGDGTAVGHDFPAAARNLRYRAPTKDWGKSGQPRMAVPPGMVNLTCQIGEGLLFENVQ